MILQTNSKLLPAIQQYGCGYMVCAWYAIICRGWEIDDVRELNDKYKTAVSIGAMTDNCFVQDWTLLMRIVGLDAEYTGRHEPKDRICQTGEIEILRFPGHFVAGNGRGEVTYDPWGRSYAVQTGQVKSKRIFRIKDDKLWRVSA